MLQELQWNTLEERRKKDRLIMFYKIHNDQTGIDTGKYLKPLSWVSRHVNNQAYEVPFAFTDYYKILLLPKNNKRVERYARRDSKCLFFDGIRKLPLI